MKFTSLASVFTALIILATNAYGQPLDNAAAGTIDLWTLVAMAMGVVILRRLTK